MYDKDERRAATWWLILTPIAMAITVLLCYLAVACILNDKHSPWRMVSFLFLIAGGVFFLETWFKFGQAGYEMIDGMPTVTSIPHPLEILGPLLFVPVLYLHLKRKEIIFFSLVNTSERLTFRSFLLTKSLKGLIFWLNWSIISCPVMDSKTKRGV